MTMFATYADKTIHDVLPQSWQPFISFKSGTVIAFLDNLMNSVVYQKRFDELSTEMGKTLEANKQLQSIPRDALTECCLFPDIDRILLRWMTERLLDEDTDAKLSGKNIPQLCAERRRLHFGSVFHDEYFVIENAWHLIRFSRYTHVSDIGALVKKYTTELFRIDCRYRYFYKYYDLLEENQSYEELRSLVERIYTNDYLNPLLYDYSDALTSAAGDTGLPKQTEFYDSKVKYAKDRVAVIISDAMRYEVGVSLFERLQADEKCTAELSVMQSVLPSVTRVGMAALLPHKELSILDADNVLADGMPTLDLKQREAILRKAKAKTLVFQFEDIKAMSATDLKAMSAQQELFYIYHNQIDARGDKFITEHEVFNACDEAIDELVWLIRRLTTTNTTHMIVTADHGFLYKRDKLTGSDKIGKVAGASDRYVITDSPVQESGVCSFPLNLFGSSDDTRMVNHPMGSDLFCAPGAGKNYVHGGCSPQETLVPVIEVKTEKAKKETTTATIDLVSLLNKITNLITTLDFIQTEPVSDVIKETTYRIFFISESGEKISNENLFKADKKDTDASKRIFRLRFSFKNQKYDRSNRYYLVVMDVNGREVLRREILIDIAFADDYGF